MLKASQLKLYCTVNHDKRVRTAYSLSSPEPFIHMISDIVPSIHLSITVIPMGKMGKWWAGGVE